MTRAEYNHRLRQVRYTRQRVYQAHASESQFYQSRLSNGELVVDAIYSSYNRAVDECPTGNTLRWSGSMYAQFPQWQVRRLLLRTKRITA